MVPYFQVMSAPSPPEAALSLCSNKCSFFIINPGLKGWLWRGLAVALCDSKAFQASLDIIYSAERLQGLGLNFLWDLTLPLEEIISFLLPFTSSSIAWSSPISRTGLLQKEGRRSPNNKS